MVIRFSRVVNLSAHLDTCGGGHKTERVKVVNKLNAISIDMHFRFSSSVAAAELDRTLHADLVRVPPSRYGVWNLDLYSIRSAHLSGVRTAHEPGQHTSDPG